MENNKQAIPSAELPQNTLQAVQGEDAAPTLRRSIRLRNNAASKLKSLNKEKHRKLATFQNHSSICFKKKNQRRKDGASLSMLPNDMLVNIMSRLPPKAFFRCRSVSKSLCTLSTVAFRLNKSFRPTVYGLFHDTLTSQGCLHFKFTQVSVVASREIDTRLRILPRHDNMKIVDCCNGLILLEAWNVPLQKHLYVYNPAVHRILAAWFVPPRKDWWRFYEIFSLAFDPRVPSLFYIVCFRGWTTKEEVALNYFQTFSSKTGKWRSQKKLGSDCKILKWNNGTFVGGKVYRLAAVNKVVSVDPIKDLFQVIQLPNVQNSVRRQIGQSQGYLHFIEMVNHSLEIWILDSQQQWIPKHQFTYHQLFGVPGYAYLGYEMFFTTSNLENPVALHPEEDVLFIPSVSGKLVAFDMKTRERRVHCNVQPRSSLVFWVYVPCYMS